MHGYGNFCVPGVWTIIFETNVEEMIIMNDTSSDLYIVQKQFTLANYLS